LRNFRHRGFRTQTALSRPVGLWGFPMTPAALVASTLFIADSANLNAPHNALGGSAIIAVGMPVYLLWRRARRSPLLP